VLAFGCSVIISLFIFFQSVSGLCGLIAANIQVVKLEVAVRGEYKQDKKTQMPKEISIMRTTGIMLFLLTFTLTGSICLSLKYDLAKSYGTIAMITIATYTFPKIVIAVINLVKAKKHDSPLIITIRNISISDALVSMLSIAKASKAHCEQGVVLNPSSALL
jgi:hypothetical protein